MPGWEEYCVNVKVYLKIYMIMVSQSRGISSLVIQFAYSTNQQIRIRLQFDVIEIVLIFVNISFK